MATTVGIRELKAHLSEYLRAVERGEQLTVTDRGRPVARMTPADQDTAWVRLVRAGLITPARRDRPEPDPIVASGTVSDLVGEQRGQ